MKMTESNKEQILEEPLDKIIEGIIEGYGEIIAEECLQKAENEYFNGSSQNHEDAVKKAKDTVKSATVESSELDSQIKAYELRELYREVVVGDINSFNLGDMCGIYNIQDILEQLHKFEDCKRRHPEYEHMYNLLKVLEKGEKNTNLQKYFELFLVEYCKKNKDKINGNGRYASLKNLINSNINNTTVSFSSEPQTLDFVFESGKSDLLLHIMLLKYFKMINDHKKLLKVCEAATNHFKNEPWFVYKYAENVTREDNNHFESAQTKLFNLENNESEKNKERLYENLGNFYFRIATSPKGFLQAKKEYEKAGNIKFNELINRAKECAEHSEAIEKILNREFTKGKEKSTIEEWAANWETIKENYNGLLNYLGKEHCYIQQMTRSIRSWVENCRKELKAEIKEAEDYIKLSKQFRKKRNNKTIVDFLIYKVRTELIPYKIKIEQLMNSISEIFPNIKKS